MTCCCGSDWLDPSCEGTGWRECESCGDIQYCTGCDDCEPFEGRIPEDTKRAFVSVAELLRRAAQYGERVEYGVE